MPRILQFAKVFPKCWDLHHGDLILVVGLEDSQTSQRKPSFLGPRCPDLLLVRIMYFHLKVRGCSKRFLGLPPQGSLSTHPVAVLRTGRPKCAAELPKKGTLDWRRWDDAQNSEEYRREGST